VNNGCSTGWKTHDETEVLSINGNKTHEVVGMESLELLRLKVKLVEDFANKEGINV